MPSKSTRHQIIERDEYTCLWCGNQFDEGNLDVHHLVPRGKPFDGPDDDWNRATFCRHHHLHLNVAQFGNFDKRWWEAGEPTLELGKCFAYGLRTRSKKETEMPQHVQDAITEAWNRPVYEALEERFRAELAAAGTAT